MSTLIYGKNAVRAAIEANHCQRLLTLERMAKDKILFLARKKGINVQFLSTEELTRMTGNASHQGFAAIVNDYRLWRLEDLLKEIKNKENPVLLMLDGIEDPHNLGAIMRSADAFSIDGIIIKNRGNAPLNATVAKTSTGAIEFQKIASVTNLNSTIRLLKERGFWIYSSDGAAATNYDEVDYERPLCLVVGSEGFGISSLVLKNSDLLIKIPMAGHVNSLNASVAAALLLSESFKARRKGNNGR